MNFQHLLALPVLFALGCQAPSNTHQAQRPIVDIKVDVPQHPPAQVRSAEWVTFENDGFDYGYAPKADILFVMDVSDSMRQVISNVVRNTNQFAQQFTQNSNVDVQIGVTTNWDHKTEAFLAKHPEGAGALRPIPGLDRRFLTKDDAQMSTKLANLLNVGILPLKDGGPEHEAFLSPVIGAIELSKRGAINDGFIRDNAHFITVLITDADDATPNLDPDEAAKKIIELKGGDASKVSAYGILVSKNDPDQFKDMGLRMTPRYHPGCFEIRGRQQVRNGLCPNSLGPDRMEQFIFSANSTLGNAEIIRSRRMFRITSPNFASNLAKMGQDIVAQISEKIIPVNAKPQIDTKTGKFQIRLEFGTPETGYEAVPESAYEYIDSKSIIKVPRPWKRKLPTNGQFRVHVLPLLI